MKTLEFWKIAFVCAISAIFTISCSDDDDDLTADQVPTAVLTAFTQEYNDVNNVEWDMENGSYIVAEFVKNGNEYDVWYTSDGTCVMTEIDHDIDISALPQEVQDGYAATTYAQQGWTIDDIDEISRLGYETIYKIEIEKNGQPDHDLYFDLNGTLYRDVEDQDDDRNEGLIQSTMSTDIQTYIDTYYPGATIVDYEKEYNGYEVDIRYNGQSIEILFSTDYTWVMTSTDCTRNIPANISAAVSTAYPGKTIDDCDYVETAAGETYYLIDLDDYDYDLIVTTDGVITQIAD